jgi:hypothetical protein
MLYLGPIDFNLHNQLLFVILIALYHIYFIFGYWVSIKYGKFPEKKIDDIFSSKFYYLSFILGTLGVIVSYNNLMLTDTFIPYNFIDDLTRGISEPGLVYSERMMSIEVGITSGSRFLNIASLFFAFFKLLFIFQFVYYWSQLGKFKRVIAISYSFFFLSSGIASGTNSVIFIFFIFITSSVVVILYIKNYKHIRKFFFIIGMLFLMPVSFFGNIMSQRGGGFEYFSSTSPLGDIVGPARSIDLENPSLFDFLYYSFVWLDYYLVQGYYGFSLILDMDHNWTFGFGSSAFLQRQLLLLTGIDVAPLTFQHRISSLWDESAQWHSFYGQFANDFGIVSLVVFLFFLGFMLAKTWKSVLYGKSFYGIALLPIYMLMFIFFPANNQVFAYIDTLSYFIFVNILLILEGRRMRFARNV